MVRRQPISVESREYIPGTPRNRQLFKVFTAGSGLLIAQRPLLAALALMGSKEAVSRLRLVHSATKISGKSIRHISLRSALKAFAVVDGHKSERGIAKMQGFVEDRGEYWLQIAGRGADDAQHIGGGGLLLERLAKFVQQPRVLDGDHSLVREALH